MRSEGAQHLGSGHRQHDRRGQRPGQRPPRRLLEERIEARQLAAGVQIGGERREDQVGRGEEEQHELRDASRRGVRVERGAMDVVRQDEEVAPEEGLGEERRRRPRRAIGDRGPHVGAGRRPVAHPGGDCAPHCPRHERADGPRGAVRRDRRVGLASECDGAARKDDPQHRLSDPEDGQRRAHPLEAASRSEVDVRDGDERQPDGADRDRTRPVAGQRRGGHDQARDNDGHARRDAGAAVDQAPERPRVARALGDRHQPHRRDVHPEPGARRGHECDLDGDRDERQPAGRQRPPEEDLHAERRGDSGEEADDVGSRAAQEDALVAHVHSVASGSAGVTRDSRGRAAAPRPRAPRQP